VHVFTADLEIETLKGEPVTLNQRLPSAEHQQTPPTLSNQQEEFIREHFSTKLEDPQTGRWIRSWRAEG